MTIEDIKYVLSSHYQGTPFDPYGQLGDERTRHMYRTIGINRQSQLAVMQIRPYRPQASRAIQWMAYQPVQHAGTVLPERGHHARLP